MSSLKIMRPLLILFLGSFLLPAHEDYKAIASFLKENCISCHGPDKEKGGVRLDNIRDIDEELWTEIHEQLESGEMPGMTSHNRARKLEVKPPG